MVGAGAGAGKGSLYCAPCDRTFTDAEALGQHRRAKHGKNRDIKPDWFGAGGGGSAATATAAAVHRSAIGQGFAAMGEGGKGGIRGQGGGAGGLPLNSYAPKGGGALDTHDTGEEGTRGEGGAGAGSAWWCGVCRIAFDSGVALTAHRRSLQPIPMVEVHCDLCGKVFKDQRALSQHSNFCNEGGGEAKAGEAKVGEAGL